MFRRVKQTPRAIPRPSEPVSYPSGFALRTETGEVFFVKESTLLRFYSERVFSSWGLEPIETSSAAIEHYQPGRVLGFRDGTLIHNYADGKLYVISGTKRRLIAGPDVLERLGLADRKPIFASDAETKLHKEGEPIE